MKESLNPISFPEYLPLPGLGPDGEGNQSGADSGGTVPPDDEGQDGSDGNSQGEGETVPKADLDKAIKERQKANKEAKDLKIKLKRYEDRHGDIDAAGEADAVPKGGADGKDYKTLYEKEVAGKESLVTRKNESILRSTFSIQALLAGMDPAQVQDQYILLKAKGSLDEVEVDDEKDVADSDALKALIEAMKKEKPGLFIVKKKDEPGTGETENPPKAGAPSPEIQRISAKLGLDVATFVKLDAKKVKAFEAKGKKDSTIYERWNLPDDDLE